MEIWTSDGLIGGIYPISNLNFIYGNISLGFSNDILITLNSLRFEFNKKGILSRAKMRNLGNHILYVIMLTRSS